MAMGNAVKRLSLSVLILGLSAYFWPAFGVEESPMENIKDKVASGKI